MKTASLIVLAITMFFAQSSVLQAKRMAPKLVPPLAIDGVEYSAPLDRMGFVVATWPANKREIWMRQIYVIKREHKLGLEDDVQTCFITTLSNENGKLKITNERGGEFELNLQTLEVKVLKGKLVIDYSHAGH